MKNFFKKFWPSLLHVGGTVAAFLSPAVQAYALGHPGLSVAILAVWGIVLHLLQSPVSPNPASKF